MIKMQYVWIRNYESPRTIVAHQHACYEFIYYLKGDGEGSCGKIRYHYEPGTFVLVEPDTVHGEMHNTQTSMISVGFCLQEHFIEPQTCCLKDDSSKIFDLVQAIRHEFKQKPSYYREYIENLLSDILINVMRRTASASPAKDTNIDYAISYIREYYMTDINLVDLAKSTGYCDDYFRIVFKKKTGMSPKEYILETRLDAAKKMLADKSISLTDISAKCGFEYYSRFSLFFKAKTSLTPSEYRKKLFSESSSSEEAAKS